MSQNQQYPKLSKIIKNDKKERPETPENLRQLLLAKEKLDIEDVSCNWSDISDKFADCHTEDYFLLKKDGKYLQKSEVDELIMSQFTEDFKKTMLDTREELQLGNNMMRESFEDIEKVLNETRDSEELPSSVQERISELLKDHEYMCSTPSQISEDVPPTMKGSSTGFDAMSGMWKMLAMRDTEEKFRTSSPTYNAFQREEPHWLERPTVSWKTLDFCKHKCEKWLYEQQDS